MADVRPVRQHSEPAGSGVAAVVRSLTVGVDAAGYPIASADPREVSATGVLVDDAGRPSLSLAGGAAIRLRQSGARLFAY